MVACRCAGFLCLFAWRCGGGGVRLGIPVPWCASPQGPGCVRYGRAPRPRTPSVPARRSQHPSPVGDVDRLLLFEVFVLGLARLNVGDLERPAHTRISGHRKVLTSGYVAHRASRPAECLGDSLNSVALLDVPGIEADTHRWWGARVSVSARATASISSFDLAVATRRRIRERVYNMCAGFGSCPRGLAGAGRFCVTWNQDTESLSTSLSTRVDNNSFRLLPTWATSASR